MVAAAVIIDGIAARYYFYSNWIRLENAAGAATAAGSVFLPAYPTMALKTAYKFASLNGVHPEEIVSATVAPDDSAITIRLRRTLPFYLSGFGVGQSSGPVIASEVAHAPHTPPARSQAFDL
jgi:hypothetical protein